MDDLPKVRFHAPGDQVPEHWFVATGLKSAKFGIECRSTETLDRIDVIPARQLDSGEYFFTFTPSESGGTISIEGAPKGIHLYPIPLSMPQHLPDPKPAHW